MSDDSLTEFLMTPNRYDECLDGHPPARPNCRENVPESTLQSPCQQFQEDTRINKETRTFMTQMLEFDIDEGTSDYSVGPTEDDFSNRFSTVQNLNTPLTSSIGASHFSAIPNLTALVSRIVYELDASLSRLLTLNPSRREAITQHLDKLAGIPTRTNSAHSLQNPLPTQSSLKTIQSDATVSLKRWIEGPRTQAQNTALKAYLEEVAVIALGQALLLKSWSDRGVRNWSESDLGRLNWALSTALKPHIPLDREGWQITRPNLYSWYNPSLRLQSDIWSALDSWRITDEGPHFLTTFVGATRKAQPEFNESSGYDSRFFQCLWENMSRFGLAMDSNTGPLKRNKVVFCPTLRDGSLSRMGPQSIQWIGLEASHFQLMIAELMHIWWEPAPPPLWSIGTG